MENNATQPGQPVDPNDALARLQLLEEEARRLREQLSQSREAGKPGSGEEGEAGSREEGQVGQVGPGSPAEHSVEPEMPPQPTPEQREEADKLIQRYRLEKQRGNKDFALRYLGEAAQIAPGYTYVLECQGDEAAENRKIEEAKRLYKLAKAQDIRNTAAETKFAELVFRSQAAPAAAHLKIQETSASGKSAAIMSAIVPGLGQFVTGQYVKAVAIFVIWGVCLVIGDPLRTISGLVGPKVNPSGMAVLGLIGAFMTYLFNLVDMNGYIKSSAAREKFMGIEAKKVERPKPPDESGGKPFE